MSVRLIFTPTDPIMQQRARVFFLIPIVEVVLKGSKIAEVIKKEVAFSGDYQPYFVEANPTE